LIERFDEAKVPDVSCYLSRTITGGVSGSFGFAEPPPLLRRLPGGRSDHHSG
jgi:catabolite regulation protein CreA